MVVTESQDGTVIDRWNVHVTFSGANVDENLLWTSWGPPSPAGGPGSPTTFTSDLREVDGTAYRLLNGQWSEESGPNASRFLTFPDPRMLVGKISPSADLRSLGTGTVDGINVTHYQARNPSVLGNLGIAGLDGSGDASFDVWVDAQNVVQRMTFSSTGGVEHASQRSHRVQLPRPVFGTRLNPAPTSRSLTSVIPRESLLRQMLSWQLAHEPMSDPRRSDAEAVKAKLPHRPGVRGHLSDPMKRKEIHS